MLSVLLDMAINAHMNTNDRTNYLTLMHHMDEAFGFKPTQASILRVVSHTFDLGTYQHTVTLQYVVTEEPTEGPMKVLLDRRRRFAAATAVLTPSSSD